MIGKPQGKLTHGAEALDLLTWLMSPWLAASTSLFRKRLSFGRGHFILLSTSRAQDPSASSYQVVEQRINADWQPSFHSWASGFVEPHGDAVQPRSGV